MKVILSKDIKGVGARGEVVEVSEGYARNYLIPRGLATVATANRLHEAELRRIMQARRAERERHQAQDLAARLSGIHVKIEARAGEGGRLFGSVTNKHIAEALSQVLGTTVDRRHVELDEPIKSLGSYHVTVRVGPEIAAGIVVDVVPAVNS